MFPPKQDYYDNDNQDFMDTSTTSASSHVAIRTLPTLPPSMVELVGKRRQYQSEEEQTHVSTTTGANNNIPISQQEQKVQTKRFRHHAPSTSASPVSPFPHSDTHHSVSAPVPSEAAAMPGPFDVICGRGNKSWNHTGNTYFRTFVQACANKYAEAPTKSMRSQVITTIMDHIKSKGNGFIRQEGRSGYWIQVDENLAREKCGQILRNVLSARYKSSTKAKFFRRRKVVVNCGVNLHDLLHSNQQVSSIMTDLQDTVDQQPYDLMDDAEAMAVFTAANTNLLNAFKKDKKLVKKFEKSLRSAHSEP